MAALLLNTNLATTTRRRRNPTRGTMRRWSSLRSREYSGHGPEAERRSISPRRSSAPWSVAGSESGPRRSASGGETASRGSLFPFRSWTLRHDKGAPRRNRCAGSGSVVPYRGATTGPTARSTHPWGTFLRQTHHGLAPDPAPEHLSDQPAPFPAEKKILPSVTPTYKSNRPLHTATPRTRQLGLVALEVRHRVTTTGLPIPKLPPRLPPYVLPVLLTLSNS